MAVTNHPRKQFLPPPWARRGKLRLAHVPGGPSETARLVLSGEWDGSPAALLSTSRYDPVLVPELVANGINAVALTWSPGFSHEGDQAQWEIVKRLLPLLKKKRIKAIAHIVAASDLATLLPEAQPLPITPPSPQSAGSNTPPNAKPHRCAMDIGIPSWRAYVACKMRAAMEAGFDGLFVDVAAADFSSGAEHLKQLWAEAASGRAADAPELLFYTRGWCSPALDDVCNLKLLEPGLAPGAGTGAAFNTNLARLKLAYEQGGRDKPFAAELAARGLTEKQRRLSAAEILASGGTCAELDLPGDYGAFLQNCGGLFMPGDPVGAIGVIVSDEILQGGPGPAQFLDSLVGASIQFDLIPLAQFERFDLRKYKLLIAAGLAPVPEPLEKALNLFVNEHGGTTYITPGPSPEELQASLIPGIRVSAGPQPVEVQAPEGVVALLWGKGTKRWVHLLNYRDEPCEAHITLPGCGGRRLDAYSPDEAPLTLNILEAGAGCATFALSGIQTYAVVAVV
ncbi:MAG: hypothetical protein ABSE73_09145 [Planctomycetota bacterium]